ncbi:MAG: HD-GYP domain-containing protein [Thermodesulfovibrionaceae bacterium]
MAVYFKSQVKEIPKAKSLVRVEMKHLQVGKPLPFDVYIVDDGIHKKVFNKGTVISRLYLEILKEKGISHIYVEPIAKEIMEDYVRKKPQKESGFDSPVVFKNYSFLKEKYFQIEKRLILPETQINFSLYLLDRFELKKIIDASEKKPIVVTEKMIPPSGDLVIEQKDIPLYKAYIESLETQVENLNKENQKELRNLVFKENSKIVIVDLLKDPRSGEKIKKVSNFVISLVETVIEEPDSIYSLLTLKGYDYYTYTHCVNVGVLATGLGIQLGLKKEDIYKLGLGAILHDIGKSEIPHEILNKQGRLNDTEYKIIQQHVIKGYEILKDRKEIPSESLIAVIQHHEKISGKGYPFKLKDGDIKIFGRIAAIADCYDALTTRRPYKPPLTPFFALSILVKEKSNYDSELLKLFIKMLGKIR